MPTPHKYADIVVPTPLDKTFHYEIPERLMGQVARGMRVIVPFGFKPLVGYVLNTMDTAQVEKTKPIIAVVDNEAVITEELFSLAKWLTEKYICSLGEALATIAPSALKPLKRESTRAEEYYAPPFKTEKPDLTVRQTEAVRQILEKIEAGENASFLLHGVTSSGKTEVYLAAIEATLKKGSSAIFLLPEISLTPQFISIMRHRFPGVLGVWHSRLSLGEKYITWAAAALGRSK